MSTHSLREVQRVEQSMDRLYNLYEEMKAGHNHSMLHQHVEAMYDDMAIETEVCCRCGRPVPTLTAHYHQGLRGTVGDVCCWDERLKATQ